MPTTVSNRVEQAIAVAQHLSIVPWRMMPTAGLPLSRWVAIGDPQAPLATYFAVLAAHDLLGDDGMLAPNVSLLSVGDHFDYATPNLVQSSDEGYALLRWLAEHSPEQVTILLGNHDTVRVQDFIGFSTQRFAIARTLAIKIKHLAQMHGERSVLAESACRQFQLDYPEITKPRLAERDYSSFTTAQRQLVMQLLLAGRCQLAQVGRLPLGQEVLITHAGVTKRDLQVLGLSGEISPKLIASQLNNWLEAAVDRVRPAWSRGELVPLDLSPLHFAGIGGQAGGGLLFHRPANPERPSSNDDKPLDRMREFNSDRPRRYHPQDLPPGLIQACGHTNHRKCLEELVPWVSEVVDTKTVGLRTLRVGLQGVKYDVGIQLDDSDATLLMLDGEMNRVAQPQDYAILNLSGWSCHS